MTGKRPIVIGIGELLWDMLPAGKRAGGAPINVVYHASKQCADGYAVSAVGKDALGDEIIGELEKNHIKYILDRNNYPTSVVEVHLQDGIPSYEIIEDVAWDHIRLLPEAVALVQKADAVCFGTLALRHTEARKTIISLIKSAPAHAIKFLDINLRQHYYSKELLQELLGLATILKINDEEIVAVRKLLDLSGTDEEVCKHLMKVYNLQYLAFTAGENYSIIYSETEKSYLPTPRVVVEDTVGAGDSFSGTFICAILHGKDMFRAHKAAVDTAAFVCTKSGAWPQY